MVNASQTVSADEFQSIVDALQIQLDRDFCRYYYLKRRDANGRCTQLLTQAVPRAQMTVIIVDRKVRWAGKVVCGFHDFAARPYALVNTSACPLSTTMSHELLEMLADPYLEGREICDAWVRRYYLIDGIGLQDFGLPKGGDFCETVGFCL